MSACTWKTSVSAASNGCCHRVVAADPGTTCTSSGLTRTRLCPSGRFSHLILPTSRYCTPSSWAICSGGLDERLYCPALLLAITLSPPRVASLPRTSSVMPSAKYSSVESPRFSKGRTARRRVVPGPVGSAPRWERSQPNSTPRPSRKPSPRRSAGRRDSGTAGREIVGAAGATDVGAAVPDSSSARANSAAVANRSAGDFARARAVAPATPSGTVSRTSRSGRGDSSIRRAIIACAVGAVKGGSPASIS